MNTIIYDETQTNTKDVVRTLTNRQIVKQSNILNSSKYSISALSYDIFNLFIAQINKDDEELKSYAVTVKDIESKLNKEIDFNSWQRISDELMSLKVTMFEQNGSVKKMNVVIDATKNKVEGFFAFTFHPGLKNYLLNLGDEKNPAGRFYTEFNLLNSVQMKGSHTKRIYAILCQYSNGGFLKISVDKLMNFLDIENKYPVYSDFKKRVLNPALKEINEKSDEIKVKLVKESKTGKKISMLEIKIEKIKIKTIKADIVNEENSLDVKSGVIAAENWLLDSSGAEAKYKSSKKEKPWEKQSRLENEEKNKRIMSAAGQDTKSTIVEFFK